ncbi:PEP/pyruvate-binding domain-containing protein [Bacillus velezensis]|uniref:PEP/pyruvate-binding domain-containing protein n=1 Tax=Bacillus velezensis TaxID=492670 RepID=UPI002E1F442F|nr:PEP/pyruvate-binding domain-containing protein [Bacillus velezensis]MED1922608.1 PEP/pyruvate-binding domain-containing protein [Bacillus velezensis]
MYSVRFQKAEESSRSAGAKGMNLIKLTKNGLPVPGGFIIQTNALTRFMEDNGLQADQEQMERAIMNGTFSKELREELTASFYELRESYASVAVRSSSASEDLEGASFAGQYETYLNIKTEEEFLGKVKECWASFFSARVSGYKEKMNNDTAEQLMGVVVQGLINSEVSGVIFSRNPVTHDDGELMISASYGLGEAIVSGSVTPDTFIVNKDTFQIEKEIGLKEMYIVSKDEGVTEKETTADMRNRFCLDDESIKELAMLTIKTEELYGYPVDLEFGFAENKLYLLQARPITTIVQDQKAADEEREFIMTPRDQKEFWLNMEANIEGPVSPLFASLIVPALEYGLKESTKAFPVMGIEIERVKLHQGRVFSRQHKTDDKLPAEQLEALFPVLADRMYDIIQETFLPFYQKLDELAHTDHTPETALNAFRNLQDFYLKGYAEHFNIVFPQVALNMILESMYGQVEKENTSLLYEMLAGVMNKSLETDRQLWLLSGQVKDSPELRRVFTVSHADELHQTLLQSNEGKRFLEQVGEFLQEYGWRSVKSHDLIEETWAENPYFALANIQNYVRNGYDFDSEFHKTIEKRKQLYADFMDRIEDDGFRETFDRYYQWTLSSSVIKDDHHFYIDAMLDAKARLCLLKIGELLQKQGVIDDREEMWYLYSDEVEKALASPVPMQEKAAERKQLFQQYQSLEAPAYLGTPTSEQLKMAEQITGSITEDEKNTEHQIYGLAASSGIASGPVKVIRDASEFSRFSTGDVLVCKMTTPLWTSLFQDAKAVITDTGGILSHAAIIAREYGLPAVLGTRAATDRLNDGDIVTVDGTNGKITIVKRASC